MTDDFDTLAGMSETANQANQPENNLASRLRKIRDDRGLSLDEVAVKAGISKTYLWELERDTDGLKKPSADVLLRIAKALSTTLAELLALATVKAPDGPVEIPPSLNEFRDRMGGQLTAQDLQELAATKFRGAQPQTVDEWHQLYFVLMNTTRRRST
ncbi:MAG: helix-turn-helix transcriptional regulator [Planctomycetaceae bacterium]|nr:helix-turn-helix transcriptional regulator [Planctomycetaceae bacterium]